MAKEEGLLTYGAPDEVILAEALKNFAGAALNGLSLCCTPIELLSNDGADTVLGTATGFFWLEDSTAFLVTNWHVVSALHAFTLKPLGPLTPRRFNFYGREISFSYGTAAFVTKKHTVTLSDDGLEAIECPPIVNGSAVDIWAMPLPEGVAFGKSLILPSARTVSCFVNENLGPRIVTRAGDDCFILGYPIPNYTGLNPPVWKRGSLASETNIGVGQKPLFLVDAATTRGMSGSPIIRKAATFTADNRDLNAIEEFATYDLIGVYAGRLLSKALEETNLGYGWYRSLIPDVISYCWHLPPVEIASDDVWG